jgi:lipopolysaccharide biosynthesis protein
MLKNNYKIAIILHLYYTDLWEEFAKKLKSIDANFVLYVTICENEHQIANNILSDFPYAKITKVQNKGLDVGPFLLTMKSILDNNIEYDFIIKLHSKKSIHHGQLDGFGVRWRNKLVDSIIGSSERLNSTLLNLETGEYGMATASEYIYQEDNIEWMSDLLNNLEINVKENCNYFAAGTMFIVRFNILYDFLNTIELDTLYQLTTPGYIHDGGIEHKLERVFGFIVQDAGYKILGI